jgi:hypothetical protein
MANVLLRSPYYISKDIGSDLSAKIEITIDGTLAYTIVKNKPANNNDFVLFEISELVRDYIDIKYNGSITASDLNVNVSYVLYKYTLSNAGGTPTNLGTTTFFGIDGYGYFEEGSNLNITKGYMQSNDIIYTLYGEDLRLPVDRNNTTSVTYLYKGSQTFTKAITTSSTEVFEYIDATDSFKERVIEDSGTYEESSCLDSFLLNNDLYLVDEVVLETEGAELIPSIDISSSSWFTGGTTPANTVITSGETSPIGDASAYNVTSPSNNSGYVSTTGIQGTDGEKVTISVFLKGTGDVQIKLQELGGDYTNYFTETITLTSNWVEHKVSGIKARDGNPSRMVIVADGSSALDVDIWHPSVRLPETKIVDVITLNECKYEPIKLTFVNRFGALQDLWFFKKSIEKVNTKKETFNRFTINSQTGVYDTSIHQNQTFNVNSSKKLTINTGYVDESYNDLMQELMQSEQIWLELNSVVTPVNLDTKSLTFKTSVNDRLVDYTVDVSYSFDAINNIR